MQNVEREGAAAKSAGRILKYAAAALLAVFAAVVFSVLFVCVCVPEN